MSLPIIQYKATNTELDESLQVLLEQKFQSLTKYWKADDSVSCAVEFEKETAHQSGKHFRVEANLTVNGTLFRADASELSFEEAVDEVRSELDKELRRDNKKHETLVKRGGRKIKEMLRFG